MIACKGLSRYSPGRRAVSDLLGYAVVFGIVVLSVSLLYTVGLGALSDLQRAEAVNNAGQGFVILSSNIDEIHRDGAPARGTEFRFDGGELTMVGQMSLSVTNQTTNLSRTFVATPITYSRGASGYHYVGGAVVRSDRDAATITNEPSFRFGTDRTLVSFVSTVPTGDSTSVGGQGTVHLSMRRVGVPVVLVTGGPITVNVSVTSPRWRAWDRYLASEGLTNVETDPENDTVVYRHRTDRLFLRQSLVRVELST